MTAAAVIFIIEHKMEHCVQIRKKKSSLVTACLEAGCFSVLALLFILFPLAAGSVRRSAVILFLALSLPGWCMVIDYFRSSLVISDEGVEEVLSFGRNKKIAWSEITSVALGRNMVFVYGKNNKILVSMDVPLSDDPQALEILKDHHVELHDHNFRSRDRGKQS